MTPLIALDLSLDGIAILSRSEGGVWWREGIVRLDVPDMGDALTRMRRRCAARVGENFTSVLIIPDSQLLFTSLERDDRDPKVTIRALLRGRTPYEVEDLTFDFIQKGDRLQVAVVALETLLEAENFAAKFGFRPVALIGAPKDATYPGLPDFGPTGIAAEILNGEKLILDLGDEITVVPAPDAPDMPEEPEAETFGEALAAVKASDADDRSKPSAEDPVPPKVAAPTFPPSAPMPSSAPVAPPRARAEPVPSVRAVPPPPIGSAPDLSDQGPQDTAAVLPEPDVTVPEVPTIPEAKPADVTPPTLVTPAAASAPSSPKVSTESVSDTPGSEETDRAPTENIPDSLDDAYVFTRAPADQRKPATKGPTFSTQRKPLSAAEQSKKPHLARITPRLSGPTAVTDRNTLADAADQSKPANVSAASFLSADKGDDDLTSATGDTPTSAPPQPTSPAKASTSYDQPRPKARNSLADRLRRQPKSPRPAPSASATTDETVAMTLPGLARENAAQPAGKSGLGMGLVLTLVLLGLMALIAAWSVLFQPGDAVPEVADDALTKLEDSASATLIPDATPEASPERAPDTDVALLLPDSSSATRSAGGSVASPVPDLVTPPLPIPGASPEEMDEAGLIDAPDDVGLSENQTDVAGADGTFETPGAFDTVTALPDAPQAQDPEDIYVASIDPAVRVGDAVALPQSAPPADTFSPQTVPAPAGTEFPTATNGLVVASAKGTLAPGGYTVVSGRPQVFPVPRPQTSAAQVATRSAEDEAQRVVLLRTRPTQRPNDAEERVERVLFNGMTQAELTRVQPRQRPASIIAASAAQSETQAAATARAASEAAAAVAASDEQNAAVQAAAAAAAASLANRSSAAPTSRLALAESNRPRTRPRSVEREAAQIVTQRREQATVASASTSSATAAPQATSRAPAAQASSTRQTIRSAGGSVARAATQSNAIHLREINLIGIYGRPTDRRALVRMSNGRYVKVKVGDRLDRGRVTAIGESELSYQKRGRNIVLRMPRV
ncbi:hypothetical protein [Jannaschia helgolandensis]|uniref:Type IV pilus biogenesis protein PilP n=1 Tax=Jannaschia helgolandensis TaxID=188906 RepID=A0A1H7R9B0_9RHOB|nr:hypothetical protein [Jannaschia helgolandensis]SEL56712.1 hypothetical protein SAMN04488526_2989 [Jannaschia helgolandensis]